MSDKFIPLQKQAGWPQPKHAHPPIVTAKTAADKAIDEKRELSKLYRARQRAQMAAISDSPEYGQHIHPFMRALRRFTINDAEEMIAFVKGQADTWLRAAPEDIRVLILGIIDSRIIAIREHADLQPFDDPMPWQEDNLFRICKRELGL